MILRRYGGTLQSVSPHFDSRALTEIGFRRSRVFCMDAETFSSTFERIEEHVIEAEADGPVQDETEAALLDVLLGKIWQLDERLAASEVLVVENEPGKDYPKTRCESHNVIVDGENRLHFDYRVGPPLRLGLYRRVAGP